MHHPASPTRLLTIASVALAAPAFGQDMLFDFQGNTPSVTLQFVGYNTDGAVLNESVVWEAATENGTNNYRRLGLNAGTRATSGQWPRASVVIPNVHANTRVRYRVVNDQPFLRMPVVFPRYQRVSQQGFGINPIYVPNFGGSTAQTNVSTAIFLSGQESNQLAGTVSGNHQRSYFEVITYSNFIKVNILSLDGAVQLGSSTSSVDSNFIVGDAVALVVGDPAQSGNPGLAFHRSFDDISIMSLSRGTDCNIDGMTDIFWRNPSTGQTYQWLMNQTAVQAFRPVGTFAGNWRIVGAGNIDNQGASDLVMQDTVTGEVRAWLYNTDGSLAARRWLGNPGVAWRASAVADLNFDAMSDIVFRNSNGSNVYWAISSSGTLASVQSLPFVGDEAWTIIGACDMNYDGQNDLLWSRHGEVVVWQLGRDGTPAAINYIGFAPTDWKFLAAGDFDGDGRDNDLMWHNTSTGDIGMWGMNAGSVASWSVITNIGTSISWQGSN